MVDNEAPAGRAQMIHRKKGLGGEVAAWPYPLPASGTRRRLLWDPLSFPL
ncbi:hypothetical protein GQ55_5G050800 [Panicum hallii var. hallii]|uniref:Uncharacterized protein n=1 Tax=Panicum hallii var. hallii TaxID=1504633 RepID=A0A2T7DCU0_9POAL|nr:hypothetical protein GQ55_5G050800 [Panicum hallii var. hallii]